MFLLLLFVLTAAIPGAPAARNLLTGYFHCARRRRASFFRQNSTGSMFILQTKQEGAGSRANPFSA